MSTATTSRLPGVYFETEPPLPEEALPRMDIAAFVGFASAGPLHTPVAVEEMGRFREIFGEDLPLAWDPVSGRRVSAYLASAVEAFFRNGGRRCWVVRVADETTALANRFALTGLVEAGTWRPAVARARAVGSWSDALTVGAVRNVGETFAVARYEIGAGAYWFDLVAPPGHVAVGDLLQIGFGSSGLVLYLPVESVEGRRCTVESSSGRNVISCLRASSTAAHWFRADAAHVESPMVIDAYHLTPDGEVRLDLYDGVLRLPEEESPRYEIDIMTSLADAPAVGDLIRIDMDMIMDEKTEEQEERRWQLLLSVREVSVRTDSSPPEDRVVITGDDGLWPMSEGRALTMLDDWRAESPSETGQVAAERLSFDLWVWRDQEVYAGMRSLAFHQDHPRFWGGLPIDQSLFALLEGQAITGPVSALAREASEPRFPLAGPEVSRPLFLPIGMTRVLDPAAARGVLDWHEPGSDLSRNGVAEFSEELFLDPYLIDAGSRTLIAEAHNRLYVKQIPLKGLHALLPLDEITLIAVPDAVQRGWEIGESPVVTMIRPLTIGVEYHRTEPTYRVYWSASTASDVTYELRESADPLFTQSLVRYRGNDLEATVPVREGECYATLYYQVRATRESVASPWSETAVVALQPSDFGRCERVTVIAPGLDPIVIPSPLEGEIVLAWSEVEGAERYVVEAAADPAFLDAASFTTRAEEVKIPWLGDRLIFFRVRAEGDAGLGPWSNTEWVEPLPSTRMALISGDDYSPAALLALQRVLLRFCAARGDMLALLSMPLHYREQEALAHAASLTPDTEDDTILDEPETVVGRVRPLSLDEEGALSYGALYHPWLGIRINAARADSFRYIPPDGAVCGAIARRAISRGAWIAPANDPLIGVIAIDPEIEREGAGRLYDAQINLVRRDPRGFLLLSADTLGSDASLRPINVRRLMILLRRLALREGSAYVFQANNRRFHRLVQGRFESLLGDMYRRGAFARGRPEQSYQVVTDSSINTDQSLEQGRFIVELRVAPSKPLAFITVRLVQSGRAELTVQEV